jgi:hypothetical protein
MPSDLENDYDSLRQEMEDKLARAIDLLKEARDIASRLQLGVLKEYDTWDDLREIVGEFIELEPTTVWESSMSSCSF